MCGVDAFSLHPLVGSYQKWVVARDGGRIIFFNEDVAISKVSCSRVWLHTGHRSITNWIEGTVKNKRGMKWKGHINGDVLELESGVDTIIYHCICE